MLGSSSALIFLLALPFTHSIYFHVSHGTKRCFLEEMPGQTLFLATYKNPDYKPFGAAGYTDGTAVIIRVLDPSGATVLSRTADVTGKIAFHSTEGGEYQLCFNTNSSYYSGAQKFVRAQHLHWEGRWRFFWGLCSPHPLLSFPFLTPHLFFFFFTPCTPNSAWT